jgi:hypothetical protein
MKMFLLEGKKGFFSFMYFIDLCTNNLRNFSLTEEVSSTLESWSCSIIYLDTLISLRIQFIRNLIPNISHLVPLVNINVLTVYIYTVDYKLFVMEYRTNACTQKAGVLTIEVMFSVNSMFCSRHIYTGWNCVRCFDPYFAWTTIQYTRKC